MRTGPVPVLLIGIADEDAAAIGDDESFAVTRVDDLTTAPTGGSYEAVVLRLKEYKYLNDAQYAAAYSSYRKENEKYGRMRVITDLKARGVHGEVIQKAVGEAYDGVNEERLARDYLRRKRLEKPADRKQAARVFRALARAGFTTRVIVHILKNWDVDDDTISALSEEQTP